MKEIDLKQIKSMEELKKELGNKYDEIMYKMNLELLERMDKAVKYIKSFEKQDMFIRNHFTAIFREALLDILQGSDKE